MEAGFPVSIRVLWPWPAGNSALGLLAPNPAKLSQLDRFWISPLNPSADFAPPVPPGEAGGVSFAWRELQLAVPINLHPIKIVK